MAKLWYMFSWVIAISLANFQSGYSLNQIHQVWNMTPCIYGFDPLSRNMINTWAVTILPLGAIVISPFAWWFISKFGKRKVLMAASLIVIVASGFKTISILFFLMLGRFLMGISTGLTSVACPMLIYDISPIKWRGAFIGIMQLMVSIGWFSSLIIGTVLPAFQTSKEEEEDHYWAGYEKSTQWRLVYLVPAIPAVLHIILMLFLFKSEFDKSVHKRGTPLLHRQASDMSSISNTVRPAKRSGASSVTYGTRNARFVETTNFEPYFLLWKKENLRALFVGLFIHFLHQIAGINMVLQYSFYFNIDDHVNQMNWRLVMGGFLVIVTLGSLFVVHKLK